MNISTKITGNLLAIIELGGYPDFTSVYVEHGFKVQMVNSMRKAVKQIKINVPDVIIAEFNFQSDFRDRTSNLETLMAVLQKYPEVKVILFYEKKFETQFRKLQSRFDLPHNLVFPIEIDALKNILQDVCP